MADAKARIKSVFQEALEVPTGERPEFLHRRCGPDALLRAKVETLLRAHAEAGPFMAEPPAATHAEGPGTTIGRYKLLQTIGEGGFGVVYMAEQSAPVTRRVALKIIKLGMDTKQVVARFEAERQALAMMDHPNIAKVFDAGATETGRPYFVMELVRGIPITEFCDKSNLGTAGRLRLFVNVCGALQHAHQKGVIHRDVKPSNVLVTLHDGVPVPKVIDFGIAKAIDRKLTEKTLFTEFRQVVGTPEYMSPEQAEMSGLDIDTRADVYSLGVLLYELLTGTKPFDAETLLERGYAEMLRVIREDDPPTPSTRVSSMGRGVAVAARHRNATPDALAGLLRGDLDWIVMRALEKDRTRRYDTAAALAADVQRHLEDEPVSASPPGRAYRMRKFVRRNRAAVAAGAGIAVALVAGAAAAAAGLLEADRRRIDAEKATAEALAQGRAATEAKADALAQARDAREATEAKSAAIAELKRTLRRSEGMRLVAQSVEQLSIDPARALLLAIEGAQRSPGVRANNALVAALDDVPPREVVIAGGSGSLRFAYPAANGRFVVVVEEGRLRVHDAASGAVLREFDAGGHSVSFGGLSNCVSADGRLLAFGIGKLGVVRIVDVVSGATVHDLPKCGPAPWGAFSPDGRWIVSGSTDGDVLVWDRATGTRVHRLEGHRAWLGLCSFASDGASLVTSDHTQIFVWDLRSGELLRTLGGDSRRTIRPAASADGRLVAAGSYTKVLTVWEVSTGRVVREFELPDVSVDWVSLSADGRRVAAASGLAASVWDTTTGERLRTVTRTSSRGSAEISPDACALLVNGEGGASLWDVASGDLVGDVRTQSWHYLSARFAPDARNLLVSDSGGNVRIVDPGTRRCRTTLSGHQPAVQWLAFSRDGTRLASACAADMTARIWDVKSGRCLRVIEGHVLKDRAPNVFRWVSWVDFNPTGTKLLTASTDGTARTWDVTTGEELEVLKNDAALFFWTAVWSPDGRRIATGGTDRVVRVWDAATGDPVTAVGDPLPRERQNRLEVHGVQANWSSDGARLLVRDESPDAKLYDAETGRWMRTYSGAGEMAQAAVFSPDGRHVVTSASDYGSRLWDVDGDQPLWTADGFVTYKGPCFSPDGSRIVMASRDGGARIVDAKDGRTVAELGARGARVQSAAFDRHGRRVLTSSMDGVSRLWDARTGEELLTLRGAELATFSPDGSLIAFVTPDADIRLVPSDPMAAAMAAKPRELTDEERVRFEIPKDD